MQSYITKHHVLVIALLALSVFYSCRVKKYIPEDEYLFNGGEVLIQDSVGIKNLSALEDELQSVLYPKPNTKFLGLYPGLHYHYRVQNKKPGFIVRFLNKKFGEEPVYFSDVKLDKTKDLIENRLENNGFFKSKITSTISKDKNSKKAQYDYTVVIGKPYELNNYTVEIDSLEELYNFPIYDQIRNSLSETILKKGTRYDLGALKGERLRIDHYLKKRGYYNFNGSFIIFQVDTNLNNNKTFNLYLKLQNGVPAKSKVPYILNKLEVFPNLMNDTAINPDSEIVINDIVFIQKKLFFRPKRLEPFILLEPGQLYNPIDSKYTSRRISSIGTYKFVNINYKEIDSTGSDSLKIRYLNANIALSPLTKRSLKAELQGVTKSNNFTGPNIGLTYLNRNIFKGGENFSATGSIGYEKQFGNNTSGSTSLQVGLNTSLVFPRLIFPGNVDKFFKYSIPKTKINLGVDYFKRSELYSLTAYSTSFGYTLNANRYVSHQLNPIEINYLQLSNRSDLFNSILDANPFLKRSFEQQFIAGLTYTFYYNELTDMQKKGRFSFKFNFDLAGNTLSLIAANNDADTTKRVLGIPYAQYVKGDVNLSYNYAIGSSGQALVGRVFGGIGMPYGNSQTLPFVKQYFSGGVYSVRAFQIRGLGPGVYNPANNDNLFFDRSGDIRLEGNLEYRFPIFLFLKGAIFADAGNIWNLNDNLPGGQFTSDFINQLGVGTGFGLRVDIQGFVIRFDLASPIKRPATTWDFEYKNPVFNFAIGYPF